MFLDLFSTIRNITSRCVCVCILRGLLQGIFNNYGDCLSKSEIHWATRPDTQHDCILERDIKSKQGTKYTNKIIQIVENVTNRRPLLTGIFTVHKLTTCPSDYLSPRLGTALFNTCPPEKLL